MESFVLTAYVDADSRETIERIIGLIANPSTIFADRTLSQCNFKNWIVDDDETPELHP